jgi:hypothetical protein
MRTIIRSALLALLLVTPARAIEDLDGGVSDEAETPVILDELDQPVCLGEEPEALLCLDDSPARDFALPPALGAAVAGDRCEGE